MTENTKTNNNQTEFAFNAHDLALIDLMKNRSLSPHECEMVTKRDFQFNLRKVIEKIIFMLPSILYSISQILNR